MRSNEDCYALIRESVEYYTHHDRCGDVVQGSVVAFYKHPTSGSICTIGRHLDFENPFVARSFELRNYSTFAFIVNKLVEQDGKFTHMDCLFKEESRGYPLQLWLDLEGFHCTDAYWNGQELTDYGKQYVEHILKKPYINCVPVKFAL